MKEALVILDMTNDFAALSGGNPSYSLLVLAILREIWEAKAKNRLIVCVQNWNDEMDPTLIGNPHPSLKFSWGADLIAPLELALCGEITYPCPFKPYIIVDKKTSNGFYETDLDQILNARRIKKLTIVGAASHRGALSTISSAISLGYEIRVPISTTSTT